MKKANLRPERVGVDGTTRGGWKVDDFGQAVKSRGKNVAGHCSSWQKGRPTPDCRHTIKDESPPPFLAVTVCLIYGHLLPPSRMCFLQQSYQTLILPRFYPLECR